MNSRRLTTIILILIVGFSGGWLVGSQSAPQKIDRPALDSAEAALAELVEYRGTGARAARKTIELADIIVAGGESMVPKLDEALGGVSRTHRYTSSGDQAPGVLEMDTERGILSRHTNATMVILEALDRIGGEEAVRILFREAKRQGKDVPAANALTAVLFLTHRGERADVRQYFNELVNQFMVTRRSDWVADRVMRIVRPWVGASLWNRLSAAFQGGWATFPMDDSIAQTLVTLDGDRATEMFLSMLSDATMPRQLRQSAARAIARSPEHRGAATEIILREADPFIINDFVRGLRHGRWDEREVLWRSAMESGDSAEMRVYDLGRLPHLREVVAILTRLSTAVGPKVSKELSLQTRIREFEGLVGQVEREYGVEGVEGTGGSK